MAKLDSMHIMPAKNGGFTVRHNFAPKPNYLRGKSGGFGVSMQPSEEHVFGPDQTHEMMRHIGKNLGVSEGLAPERAEEAEVGGKMARTAGMRPARRAEAEVSGEEQA